MPAEETEGLKNLSASCEENITKDEYGEKELANRYGYYIQRSDKPLHYTNKNELYLRLCEGFLCDNGKLWFSLCKLSDRICSMLPPTEILRDDIEYERLDTLSLCESRFPEVKVLGCAASYSLTCTLGSQMFSPQNMYACYLVFKYEENNKQSDDNHHLFKAEYGTLEGTLQGKVLVRMYARSWNVNEDALEYAVESWMTERNDGWMEVMLSKPFNVFENHSMLKVRLSKLKGSFKGIIVEGVEFRPYI